MMRKPKELRGTAQSNYSEICKLGHILEQEGCSFSENEKQKKKQKRAKQKRNGKKGRLVRIVARYGLWYVVSIWFNFVLFL